VEGWGITATALSQDGELLALGSGDGTIRIWDRVEHRLIATIHQHRDRITALSFTHDGEWLVSSSLDRTLRLWDVGAIWEAGTCALLNTMRSGDRVITLTFSPDETTLVAAGSTGELTLWDVERGTLLKTIPGHRAAITALTTSLNGRWLASGSDDSTIKLWEWGDRATTLNYGEQLPCGWAVKALTFSPDQHMLISGGSDGTLQIWRQC
jgi:dipeptidyl aminopeptidase/acylaminoacyl peptidase